MVSRITLLIVTVLSMVIFTFIQGKSYGWFTTGQDADILLSGIDFNNAGYLETSGDGLLFNHPGNIATDGTRLSGLTDSSGPHDSPSTGTGCG